MEDDKNESYADMLLSIAEKEGVAVTTVSDGHVLVFTRNHLQGILDKIDEKGTDKAIVFVRRVSSFN